MFTVKTKISYLNDEIGNYILYKVNQAYRWACQNFGEKHILGAFPYKLSSKNFYYEDCMILNEVEAEIYWNIRLGKMEDFKVDIYETALNFYLKNKVHYEIKEEMIPICRDFIIQCIKCYER